MANHKINASIAIAVLLAVPLAHGQDANQRKRYTTALSETRKTHETSSVVYNVECFWIRDIPRVEGDMGRHLIAVWPASKHTANRARIERFMDRLLSGESVLNAQTVARWNTAMADADLKLIPTDDKYRTMRVHGLPMREQP